SQRLLECRDLRDAVDHCEIRLPGRQGHGAACILEVLAGFGVVRGGFTLARADAPALVERKRELKADLAGGDLPADAALERSSVPHRAVGADDVDRWQVARALALRLELSHVGDGLLNDHRIALLLGEIDPGLRVIWHRRREAD